VVFSVNTIQNKTSRQGTLFMNKGMKLFLTLCVFASVAVLVYFAGESALSDSPILALVPVGVVLFCIVLYIRFSDKKD